VFPDALGMEQDGRENLLPKGAKVLMFLAAANRNPRRWEEPGRFDITRNAAGHVGFGAGIHMCVGQVVARLEGEAMLAALAKRFRRMEIAGTTTRCVACARCRCG
jgi:cytochrome P450